MFVFLIVPMVVFGNLFVTDNEEFFNQVGIDKEKGYEWQYTGVEKIDEGSKSIPLQIYKNGKPHGKKFVLWKLKKD